MRDQQAMVWDKKAKKERVGHIGMRRRPMANAFAASGSRTEVFTFSARPLDDGVSGVVYLCMRILGSGHGPASPVNGTGCPVSFTFPSFAYLK
ncbi:hypothetical protein CEXT_459261 [Caerostris extrusa]|uniref:Uncharacterized protein n=1 Tax=Caerostris extrusa TaxID=172846 RepID=A0AAV4Q9M0_CAEEX|nr:hypothetical protein CEXT_459261 [Caerostris extrusa]